MRELQWWELFMPRGMTIDTVAGFVRPLASRPRIGILRRTPLIVIEQWQIGGDTRYFMGLDLPLSASFARQQADAVPGLVIRQVDDIERPTISRAADISLRSASASLRTDMAVEVSRAVGAALSRSAKKHALVLQWIIGPAQQRQVKPGEFSIAEQLGLTQRRTPSALDSSQWRKKASEPLFAVRGRIGTTAEAVALGGLRRAVQLADSAEGHLHVGRATAQTADALNSLRTGSWGGILSASELAVMLALPIDGTDRALPIGDPASPTSPTDGRLLGSSLHAASMNAPVMFPTAAIPTGLLVIGPTGSGKSNLLASIALSDIANGRPVVVIEPKGELCDAIMERLDPAYRHRVVAIDAGETAHPVGSNVLAGDPADAERRADDIVGLFHQLHGAALGPRSADVLLHGLILAAKMPGGTLIDVPALLTNTNFRRRIAQQVSDPMVLAPWLAWFDNLSDSERSQVVAPILNKLRGFTSRTSIRRMLGQADPGWSWDEALKSGGIVLISLNRGVLGTEATAIAGSLLLGQLWGALQRRSRLVGSDRRLASIIVDEWQLFTGGLDFADVLATIRGAGVAGLSLANQNLAQLSPQLRAAVAANARSKITFAPSKDDARTLAGWIDSPSVTPEDLLRLGEYEAVASIRSQPGSPHFKTHALPRRRTTAAAVREMSSHRFGQSGQAVDAELLAKWQGPEPDAGIGRQRRGPS
jgi:post-segregation antitoxin (ccd killing protein)